MQWIQNIVMTSSKKSSQFLYDEVFPLYPNFFSCSIDSFLEDPALKALLVNKKSLRLITIGHRASYQLENSSPATSHIFDFDEILLIGSRKHSLVQGEKWDKYWLAELLKAFFSAGKSKYYPGNQSFALKHYKDFEFEHNSLVKKLLENDISKDQTR